MAKKIKIKIFHDWRIASLITVAIGLIIVYFNFLFFQKDPQIFGILNLFAAILALSIPIAVKYRDYSRIKNIEKNFPNFLRDITENVNAGMTLPKAIKVACKNDYDKLTPFVKSLPSKIELGISFERCLDDFAKSLDSDIIKRAVKTIIEAHRSGGKINTVLDAVVNSVKEIETIKKERSARIYGQMVTGYFIFILFLGVMFGLSKFLIPALAIEGFQMIFYGDLFRNLVVIQGIFAGLGIGKMSEGTIIAGVKHSFVLAVMGYTAFVVFG